MTFIKSVAAVGMMAALLNMSLAMTSQALPAISPNRVVCNGVNLDAPNCGDTPISKVRKIAPSLASLPAHPMENWGTTLPQISASFLSSLVGEWQAMPALNFNTVFTQTDNGTIARLSVQMFKQDSPGYPYTGTLLTAGVKKLSAANIYRLAQTFGPTWINAVAWNIPAPIYAQYQALVAGHPLVPMIFGQWSYAASGLGTATYPANDSPELFDLYLLSLFSPNNTSLTPAMAKMHLQQYEQVRLKNLVVAGVVIAVVGVLIAVVIGMGAQNASTTYGNITSFFDWSNKQPCIDDPTISAGTGCVRGKIIRPPDGSTQPDGTPNDGGSDTTPNTYDPDGDEYDPDVPGEPGDLVNYAVCTNTADAGCQQ